MKTHESHRALMLFQIHAMLLKLSLPSGVFPYTNEQLDSFDDSELSEIISVLSLLGHVPPER